MSLDDWIRYLKRLKFRLECKMGSLAPKSSEQLRKIAKIKSDINFAEEHIARLG
jgi:hypothetical protein